MKWFVAGMAIGAISLALGSLVGLQTLTSDLREAEPASTREAQLVEAVMLSHRAADAGKQALRTVVRCQAALAACKARSCGH